MNAPSQSHSSTLGNPMCRRQKASTGPTAISDPFDASQDRFQARRWHIPKYKQWRTPPHICSTPDFDKLDEKTAWIFKKPSVLTGQKTSLLIIETKKGEISRTYGVTAPDDTVTIRPCPTEWDRAPARGLEKAIISAIAAKTKYGQYIVYQKGRWVAQ